MSANWQTVVGVVGAILAIGGYIWYKIREAAGAQADAVAAQAKADQADKARAALEAQAQAKAAMEQKKVQDEIDQALAKPVDQRTQAALDVLRDVRGKL